MKKAGTPTKPGKPSQPGTPAKPGASGANSGQNGSNAGVAKTGAAVTGISGAVMLLLAAGATLVGIGCAVEKGFQGGGDRLRAAGVNLKSLAIIESAEPGNIVFRGED